MGNVFIGESSYFVSVKSGCNGNPLQRQEEIIVNKDENKAILLGEKMLNDFFKFLKCDFLRQNQWFIIT